MMLSTRCDHTHARERVIAESIRDVATELRLVNVEDYVAFIRVEQFANLATLVNSSTELFFKPATLRFGFSGDANVTWNVHPTIALDMEFHHLGVAAYFRLLLQESDFGVEMQYISFKGTQLSPEANTEYLRSALDDARIAADDRPLDAAHGVA